MYFFYILSSIGKIKHTVWIFEQKGNSLPKDDPVDLKTHWGGGWELGCQSDCDSDVGVVSMALAMDYHLKLEKYHYF